VKILLQWCVTLLIAVLPRVALAQAPPIEYTLTIKNPLSHLYDVEVQISGIRSNSIDVAMPAWSPGVYAIPIPMPRAPSLNPRSNSAIR